MVGTGKELILKEGKSAQLKMSYLHKRHVSARAFQIIKKHSPLLGILSPLAFREVIQTASITSGEGRNEDEEELELELELEDEDGGEVGFRVEKRKEPRRK